MFVRNCALAASVLLLESPTIAGAPLAPAEVSDVAGAEAFARQIEALDARAAATELPAESRSAAVELSELASERLRWGVAEARASSATSPALEWSDRFAIARTLQNAEGAIRDGVKSVRTYISGPDKSWRLAYRPWKSGGSYQPYAHGSLMSSRAYDFQLRRAEPPGECEVLKVQVWDDPTKYDLGCD